MRIALVLAVVLVLGLLLTRDGRSGQRDSGQEATTGVTSLATEPEPLAPSRVAAVEATATVEDALKSYWGPEWPEVQEVAVQLGIELDQPFPLRPWTEVGDEIQRQFCEFGDLEREGVLDDYVRWPEEPTLEWLDEQYRVPSRFTESDLYEVTAAVAELNDELSVRSHQYAEDMGHALERAWSSGTVTRVPYSTALVPGGRKSERRGFYAKAAVFGGWALGVTLTREQFPGLDEQADRLSELQSRRDRTVRAVLARFE